MASHEPLRPTLNLEPHKIMRSPHLPGDGMVFFPQVFVVFIPSKRAAPSPVTEVLFGSGIGKDINQNSASCRWGLRLGVSMGFFQTTWIYVSFWLIFSGEYFVPWDSSPFCGHQFGRCCVKKANPRGLPKSHPCNELMSQAVGLPWHSQKSGAWENCGCLFSANVKQRSF